MSRVTLIASTRTLTGIAAAARIGAGMAFVAAPALVGRVWVGSEADAPGTATFAQALGARDALLGIGALVALCDGTSPRRWLQAGAVADASDALVSLLHPALPPRRRLVVTLIAAGSAIGYTWLASRVERS
jgi:hypothetical protein